MREEECAYCGERGELTRDHVPPQCLFGKPRPNDLITVPCCEPCNRDVSKDDEYFRIAITTGIDAAKFPKENADSVRAINNLARSASQRFARSLLQSYQSNPGRLRVDKTRVRIVLHRVVKGLFYHHTNVRLPGTVRFAMRWIGSSASIEQPGLQSFPVGLDGNLISIGQGVFRYGFWPFEAPDPFGTIWLMRFYDHRTFVCVTTSN